MKCLHSVACLCCLVLLGLTNTADGRGDLASRLEDFKADRYAIISASRDVNDWRDYSDALEAAYRRWFPDGSLELLMEGATRTELEELFYETYAYSLDAGRKSEGADLEKVFDFLEQEGWADDKFIKHMHEWLLTFRLFDQARDFRHEHPEHGLLAPPPIVPLGRAPVGNLRTVLGFTNRGLALERQAIDLQSVAKVLVIGHPRCHFSQNAVGAIAADPELSKAMSAAAIWLTPPSTSLTDGVVAGWNERYPQYAYRYVEFKSDWPEVNYWGTPGFYFVENGRLVKKVVGWPSASAEERKEALRAGLRAIGALPEK